MSTGSVHPAHPARSDMRIDIEPFFLDGPRGSLFCVFLTPAGATPRGAVLYLHPFAEEMHKSRRMAALQARAFAALGQAVLQVDLTGCGDSAGDFADATWSLWREDARLAHDWLVHRTHAPVALWGLRSGALLAADVAADLVQPVRLLFWQPVVSGEQFLNQFLRIKLASEMLAEGQAQSGGKALRAQLEAGEPIEIGGYMLSPAMARELAGLKLASRLPPCPVDWLEVGAMPGDQVTPASQRVVDAWRTAGATVATVTVPGDPFWITQEITECPRLITATRALLEAGP